MSMVEIEQEEVVEVAYTKSGKLRKRKPKKSMEYFTMETQEAILQYNSEKSTAVRNRIYNEKISYAFYKLAENIIHTFKFYYTEIEDLEELKHEVVAFLMEKLSLFHHSKNINDRLYKIIIKEYHESYTVDSFIEYTGNSTTVTQDQINEFISRLELTPECLAEVSKITPPKAYSYFGTIAKRYLIVYNNANYKRLKGKAPVEDIDEDKTITNRLILDQENRLEDGGFLENYITYVNDNLHTIFTREQDLKVGDAVMELFKRRETIDIENKKMLFIYIKEITDTPSPIITRVVKVLKGIYLRMLETYLKEGSEFDIFAK